MRRERFTEFPILGGRLLKTFAIDILVKTDMFPILGGRLLKGSGETLGWLLFKVSNPWREAIEDSCAEK